MKTSSYVRNYAVKVVSSITFKLTVDDERMTNCRTWILSRSQHSLHFCQFLFWRKNVSQGRPDFPSD